MPGNEQKSEQWSAESKFAVVVETTALSETELSEYCRNSTKEPAERKKSTPVIMEPSQGRHKRLLPAGKLKTEPIENGGVSLGIVF